jgi:hypothetical protein
MEGLPQASDGSWSLPLRKKTEARKRSQKRQARHSRIELELP